jgi:hypothetical protein
VAIRINDWMIETGADLSRFGLSGLHQNLLLGDVLLAACRAFAANTDCAVSIDVVDYCFVQSPEPVLL